MCNRFDLTNGHLLYQLQYEVANVKRGSSSVTVYFKRLKKLWDEMLQLSEMLDCTCGVLERCSCDLKGKIMDTENRTKFMQLLMGFYDVFYSVRS